MSLCHVLLGSVLPRIVYMVPGAGVPLLRGQEVQIQPDITNASPFYLFFLQECLPPLSVFSDRAVFMMDIHVVEDCRA